MGVLPNSDKNKGLPDGRQFNRYRSPKNRLSYSTSLCESSAPMSTPPARPQKQQGNARNPRPRSRAGRPLHKAGIGVKDIKLIDSGSRKFRRPAVKNGQRQQHSRSDKNNRRSYAPTSRQGEVSCPLIAARLTTSTTDWLKSPLAEFPCERV